MDENNQFNMTENNFAVTEPLGDTKLIVLKHPLLITCPHCLNEMSIKQDELEDCLTSDPHDPLEDVFECPECYDTTGMFAGLEANYDGIVGRIKSDGSYVYFEPEVGKAVRIV